MYCIQSHPSKEMQYAWYDLLDSFIKALSDDYYKKRD